MCACVRLREHVALAREALGQRAARQARSGSFSATGRRSKPSARSASQTSPMPPRPEHPDEAIGADEGARFERACRQRLERIEARQRVDEIARFGARALLQELREKRS